MTKVPYTNFSYTVECIPYQCSNAKVIQVTNIIFLTLSIHTEEKPYKCNELYHLYINVSCHCITEMIMLCKSNHSLFKYNPCLHIAIKSPLNKMKYQTEERPCVCTKRDKTLSSILCMCDSCNSTFIIKVKYMTCHSVIGLNNCKNIAGNCFYLMTNISQGLRSLTQTNLPIYIFGNYIPISKPTNANLCTSCVKNVTYRIIKLLYLEILNRIVIKPFSCTDCEFQDTFHVTRIMIYEILHMILRLLLRKSTHGE